MAPPFRKQDTPEASGGGPKPTALGRVKRLFGMDGVSAKVSPAGTPRSGSSADLSRSGSMTDMKDTSKGAAASSATAKSAATAPAASPKQTAAPLRKETEAAITIQAAARGRAVRRGT